MARKPAALTIVCLIVLAVAGTQSAQATFAGRAGLIAGAAEDGLHVFKPDGSGDRLVAEMADVQNPAWSPDGRRIAFAARPGGTNPFHIFVVGVKSGKVRQITDAPQSDSAPSWAPNGRRIAFVRDMPQDDAVFSVRLKGTHMRQIAEGPYINDAEYSPDGKAVAVVYPTAVWLMDPRGISRISVVAEFASDDGAQVPGSVSWAPDGRRLAIGTVANGPCEQCSQIWSVRRNGNHLKQLTTGNPAGYGAPFYRPNGGKIAFCFTEWNQDNTALLTELRLMNQNGKNAHRIGSTCGSSWQALPQH
jgi:Tol biopolymer transport system component